MFTTQELLQQGSVQARSGDREQARITFRSLVAEDPTCYQAWLWLSELTNNLEEQTEMLEKAMCYLPEDAGGQKNLAVHLAELRGSLPIAAASPTLQRKTGATPEEVARRAERLAINGRRAEAFALLKELVASGAYIDEFTWLLFSELSPELSEKVRALQNAISANPLNSSAAALLRALRAAEGDPIQAAHVLEQSGEFEQALDLYTSMERSTSSPAEQAAVRRHICRVEGHLSGKRTVPGKESLPGMPGLTKNAAKEPANPLRKLARQIFLR